MESGNGKKLDLELLFNLTGGTFKPDEDGMEEDCSLQAALSAQVRKTNYENRGAAVQDRTEPKKNQESRPPRSGSPDIAKLTQSVLGMHAEMGSMRKAMIRSGSSSNRSPTSKNQRNKIPKESRRTSSLERQRRRKETIRSLNVL